jgi:hypothetical protein
MINIGIVFTDNTGNILEEFCIDILPRSGYKGDKSTLEWWMSDPKRREEYNRILKNGIPYLSAMDKLNQVLSGVLSKNSAKKVYWVARPAAYDWMFLKCYHDLYISSFVEEDRSKKVDIGFSATCLSSIREVWKMLKNIEDIEKYIRENWTKDLVMTHNGLDDAKYQAKIYHSMMKELEEMKK